MSSIETTLKNIQDGMNKINEGIEQLKQISFKDIVKEEQLKKFKIDDNNDKADEMSRKEIREYYEGK